MWPFRSVPRASPKRVTELENQLGDHEAAIAWLRRAVRELNARVAAVSRREKPAEDAPQETIAEPEVTEYQPPPHPATAHLSRRFRVGG